MSTVSPAPTSAPRSSDRWSGHSSGRSSGRPARLAGVAVLGLLALTACTPNPNAAGAPSAASASGSAPTAVKVTLTDEGCAAEPATIPAGTVTFTIANQGSLANEFEVLAEDRLRIITEKENIGPGTTTTLTTALPEGALHTACKPNMVGPLVGVTAFAVTPGEGTDPGAQAGLTDAVASYEAYIQDQVEAQVAATKEFAAAYRAGDREEARRLYPLARQHYERIEPTAEAFGLEEPGDLDAALDARVQDLALEAGAEVTDPEILADWTGWHRIEAELFGGPEFAFPDEPAREAVVEKLLADTALLDDLVHHRVDGPQGQFAVTVEDVAGGAAALLEEVALSKITGEEETFSHTDLYDVQANLEGARVAYGTVGDIVEAKDPELARQVTAQLDAVQATLTELSTGTGEDGVLLFPSYAEVASVQEDAGTAPAETSFTPAQRDLSDAVNGLAEPLSRVTGTVLQ